MDGIRAAFIRNFFTQMRSAAFVVAIVTAYVVATAWQFVPLRLIVIWIAMQGGNQLMRAALLAGWQRRARADHEVARWAHIYTLHMIVSGAIWGSTMFLFVDPAQPITVALILCSIYGVSAGSMPGQAYYPPALYALVVPMYLAVVVRLGLTGDRYYILLGVTSLAFAITMAIFCRGQARMLEEGFRIRFENERLVASLTEQTAQAEQARRTAERASLAKSQFLAAASHDLRQPLYALSLFSDSLATLTLDHEGRRVVGSIQNSVAAMETLFVGLLDISKLEAGVVRPAIAPVSIDALFDRLSQYFHPVAIGRGLDLRFRCDGEWVASDEALLEQVASNLVSNALRYTVRGGVLIAARRRGEGIAIEVWDTGPGIGEHDRERIFEEFVQLDNPERERGKGLGLGLSIARRSAALLDTDIALASRSGRGSRFEIVQPRVDPPRRGMHAAARPASIPTLARDPALPVLVVEDDRDVRLALGDLLRRWDVAADAVEDAAAALALVAAGRRYGAVVSDYRLAGGMHGLDLLERLVAVHPVPAPAMALITGDLHPDLIAAAHARAIPLLLKPLNADDLRTLLGLEPAR
ncbi:ATP-binding protein [Sphingomonas sp. RP10(2022)]|uniref:histidine kinase n=1 Tax=Sphingomonas liriopis TaxID=2949094 RepID=A0A9X2KP22_9SPHN|nr:ATP-binding protein [Sphingomonas liriopis]MCP3734244.1 ATP-binding protein [Sphingomonas liriopis]